jgi:hypothetical protein
MFKIKVVGRLSVWWWPAPSVSSNREEINKPSSLLLTPSPKTLPSNTISSGVGMSMPKLWDAQTFRSWHATSNLH